MKALARSAIVAWLCGSALALAANGIAEDHIALVSILGGALLGLFALGAGLRQWIVVPAIEKQSAEQREDWHELRDEIVGMLHRIENASTQTTSELGVIKQSLADLWKEHEEIKGGAACLATQSISAIPRKRRATDQSGSDFSGVRGRS